MEKYQIKVGDNIQLMKQLPDNSIDSIVSDPPYGLSFMNKKWDYVVPSVEFWKEVYRVLKPGGHILSFGGTRTYHRMVVNMEYAGFEIRDQIMWLYGSGFPKSLNIGKAIYKIEGNEREVVGLDPNSIGGDREREFINGSNIKRTRNEFLTKGQTQWEGWGTAIKPANEPICLARKPLSEKSVAENVLKWGTGGINVDGCRVGSEGGTKAINFGDNKGGGKGKPTNDIQELNEGRFPANIILECICDEVIKGDIHTNPMCPCRLMDEQSGGFNDKGGASRFFYQAKVSKKERNMGLDGFEDNRIETTSMNWEKTTNGTTDIEYKRITPTYKNNHPTVKPVQLMAYLCRLITPPGGTILDPYMGSGSTGIAALLEGFNFIGMEMNPEYAKIAEARISNYEEYKQFLKK